MSHSTEGMVFGKLLGTISLEYVFMDAGWSPSLRCLAPPCGRTSGSEAPRINALLIANQELQDLKTLQRPRTLANPPKTYYLELGPSTAFEGLLFGHLGGYRLPNYRPDVAQIRAVGLGLGCT